jgi:hypothetical protein
MAVESGADALKRTIAAGPLPAVAAHSGAAPDFPKLLDRPSPWVAKEVRSFQTLDAPTPICAAFIVFAVMSIAATAHRRERLTGGAVLPIDVGVLPPIAKFG